MAGQDDQHRSLFYYLIPRQGFIKWFAITVLALLVAGFAFVQYYAAFHFKPFVIQSVGVKEYQRIKKFWKKKLECPAEYIDGVPVSADLRQAKIALTRSKNNLRFVMPVQDFRQLTNLMTNLSKNDRDKLSAAFQVRMPYIKAAQKLAKQTLTDIEPLSSGDLLPIHYGNRWEEYSAYEMQRIYAMFLSTEENYEEAFENYIMCFPLLLACPYQAFNRYKNNRYYLGFVTTETALCIHHISSTIILREGLQTLNRIEPFLFQEITASLDELRLISHLKQADSFNPQVDTKPGKTYLYYINQIVMNRNDQKRRFYKRIPLVWQFVIAGRRPTDEEIASFLQPISFSSIFHEYFALQSYRPWSSANFKRYEANAAAEFDILRLQIAARLYKLETGKKVTATSDLVPKYFPEEITNRESGDPYHWDENGSLSTFQ